MGLIALQNELDWANQTNVHLLGLSLTILLAFGILLLPRRLAPGMLLILACFIPAGQRVVVQGFDFSFQRILILFGWLRICVRREHVAYRLHRLDLALLAWATVGLVVYPLLRGSSALILKLGDTFDAVGLYFLFRCLVREWMDLDRLVLTLTLLSVPVVGALFIERCTGRNLFSVFGGVPEFTEVREGRLRCQGAFSHPILAGCFWAAALPLIAARWWAERGARAWALLGIACSAAIIVLTASSTPVMAAGTAALGWTAFLARRYLKVGRIAILAGLVGMQLVMANPVWHLLARFNVVGGSTGWHRYYLLDQTLKHFGEWWLLGIVSTAHWGYGLSDLTNQYVLEAAQGGLFRLLLFLALVALAFQTVGRAWPAAWPARRKVALTWALGVALLTQCMSFFGVAYFGQIWIIWFLVLACLGSIDTATSMDRGLVRKPLASALAGLGPPAPGDNVRLGLRRVGRP